MNKIVTQDRSPASTVALSQHGAGSFLQPESLGDVVRFAELMCQSKAGIPAYLHGNAPDCMAITLQALQWSFNPFSVAQKSYKIKDVIAYEAQLIAAVINTRADVKRRPQIEYRGEGAKRKCIVTFEFKDGSVQIYESPEFANITPKNSPLWKSDPDQQQAYYSLRAGARRYCPEVILGAYDRDEVDDFRGPDKAKNITPAFDPLSDEPIATQQVTSEREQTGAADTADEPHDAVTGEIIDNTNTDEAAPSSSSVADDAAPSVSSAEPETSAPKVSGSIIPDEFRQHFIDFARKALTTAADKELTEAQRNEAIEDSVIQYRDVIPEELWGKLSGIKLPIMYVVTGQRTKEKAASFIARDVLDCDPAVIGG